MVLLMLGVLYHPTWSSDMPPVQVRTVVVGSDLYGKTRVSGTTALVAGKPTLSYFLSS